MTPPTSTEIKLPNGNADAAMDAPLGVMLRVSRRYSGTIRRKSHMMVIPIMLPVISQNCRLHRKHVIASIRLVSCSG